jgi:hypothetical protein
LCAAHQYYEIFRHNHWSFAQEANTSGDNEGAELKDHTEVIVKVGKNQLFKGFTKLVLRIEPKILLMVTVFIVKTSWFAGRFHLQKHWICFSR